MNNSWNLSGDANTYKKQDKSWANQSPEKKNTFAGVPHSGYQTGQDPVKMVVQKSGMMSSQNPLSTTTRYYTNPYEAKRQVDSVANIKNEQRDHYLKGGAESKGNPLTNNVEGYYQNYQGKKMDERPDKPQPKQPKY